MNRKALRSIIAVILALIMVISLFSFIFTLRASADDATSTESMTSEQLEDELQRLNNEKKKAKDNVANAQNKVQQLKDEQALVIEAKIALEERNDAAQKEIEIIEQQIVVINEDIRQYGIKIDKKAREVAAAKDKEDEQMAKYRERIRAMEENGDLNILSFLFGADTLGELLTAFDDYSNIMESDMTLYNQLQDARKHHESVKKEYEDLKKEAEEIKAGYEKDIAELEDEKADLEKQIAESEEEIEEYNKKIKEAEEEQKRMEAIEAAAASAASNFLSEYYAAKAAQQSAGTASAGGAGDGGSEGVAAASGGMTVYADGNGTGSLCWPFPGHTNITSPFGQRASTNSFHTGIDIDGYQSMGSPIVAADSGVVIKAAYSGGYGNCIIIDHGNGMSTLYAHLSSMYVSAGTSVSKGQTIGGVGNTGTCYGIDGIHLHFEVLINGSQVNPAGYI